MKRTYTVGQIIAIRKKAEAKAKGTSPTAQVASTGEDRVRRPRLVKGGGFASDEGKVSLMVTGGELALALGIAGPGGDAAVGAALATVARAVSQPRYEVAGDEVRRIDERVAGIEGMKDLQATFGPGERRRLWLCNEAIADAMGDDAFGDAFDLLMEVTCAREATRARKVGATAVREAALAA